MGGRLLLICSGSSPATEKPGGAERLRGMWVMVLGVVLLLGDALLLLPDAG